MSKKLTTDDVAKLAQLAKLQLTDEELKSYLVDLQAIFGYVDMLADVNTDGLEPTSQVTGLTNVMRPDVVVANGPAPNVLLAGVPEREKDYIKVRRMI